MTAAEMRTNSARVFLLCVLRHFNATLRYWTDVDVGLLLQNFQFVNQDYIRLLPPLMKRVKNHNSSVVQRNSTTLFANKLPSMLIFFVCIFV